MENRGSRPFGYWDSSYRAKLRRTWIALPFCIVAAVAMPIFTAVKYGDVVSGLAFSVVLAVVWACQLMYAKSKAKAEAETRNAVPDTMTMSCPVSPDPAVGRAVYRGLCGWHRSLMMGNVSRIER